MKLIFEKSRAGRRASTLPRHDLPPGDVPEELRREHPPRLPELAEPEVLRHFTELATRTFGIDTGFYPLGSCTMKHNPRVNERVVALPGFRDLHRMAQGCGHLFAGFVIAVLRHVPQDVRRDDGTRRVLYVSHDTKLLS